MPLSVSSPDAAQKRKNWAKTILKIETDKLVFSDESNVNNNMTRIYGRSLGGTRSVDKTPLIHLQIQQFYHRGNQW